MLDWKTISKIKKSYNFRMCNGGWKYDSYPELESLDAGKSIPIGKIQGPAVITQVHIMQHFVEYPKMTEEERQVLSARGLIFVSKYCRV